MTVGMFCVLIVGCEVPTSELLARTMGRLGLPSPRTVRSEELGADLLVSPEPKLVFTEEGCAERVLDYRDRLGSDARIVLVGDLTSRGAFELARRGVHSWIEDPYNEEQIIRAMELALRGPEELQRVAVAQLGRRGLKEAQRLVRRSMIEEAVLRTSGNRHAAARLLRVDRRAVQLALKELDDEDELATDPRVDMTRMAHERVRRHIGSVVTWRELPVQTVEWVGAVFGRLSTLTADEAVDLVIDLGEAAYPEPAVRSSLQTHFRSAARLNSVSIAVGNNEPLALAARVVLADAQPCPVTLHENFRAAVESATRAGERRSA